MRQSHKAHWLQNEKDDGVEELEHVEFPDMQLCKQFNKQSYLHKPSSSRVKPKSSPLSTFLVMLLDPRRHRRVAFKARKDIFTRK